MDILYLLVPLSLVFVFIIAIVFWWNLKSGQFEDLEGPGYRILMDDDLPEGSAPPNRPVDPATATEMAPARGNSSTVDADQSALPDK